MIFVSISLCSLNSFRVKEQIKTYVGTCYMNVGRCYRVNSTAFSLRHSDTDACDLEHFPVIISVAKGNNTVSTELLNIFLFLYIVVFTFKNEYFTINSLKFFLCLSERISS